ncbi:MAG: hypothetical protein ACRDPS_01460 [Nocardioides sp.]|uniref:hypothetical protein n=1 Tax=Nocardioides sp. TaxID=35761 RepID=UPI003D6A78C0
MTTTPTETPGQNASGYVTAGWIFVVLFPFVGLCIGVDAYTRGRKVEGRQIMVAGGMLSLFWVVGALLLMAA